MGKNHKAVPEFKPTLIMQPADTLQSVRGSVGLEYACLPKKIAKKMKAATSSTLRSLKYLLYNPTRGETKKTVKNPMDSLEVRRLSTLHFDQVKSTYIVVTRLKSLSKATPTTVGK